MRSLHYLHSHVHIYLTDVQYRSNLILSNLANEAEQARMEWSRANCMYVRIPDIHIILIRLLYSKCTRVQSDVMANFIDEQIVINKLL